MEFFASNPQLGAEISEVNIVDQENMFSYIVKDGFLK